MTDINKLAVRLRELSQAAADGRWSEFSMRVPAEPERDADLVLQTAANELQRLERQPIRWKPVSDAPNGREVVVWVPGHGIASAHLYVDEWVGLIPPEPRPTHFAEIVGPGGES